MKQATPTRIAVAILLRNNAVWIQKRPRAVHLEGLWEFPGGKIAADETPLAGLLRELEEETGLTVPQRIPRLLWVRSFSYPDRDLRLFFFLVQLADESLPESGRWAAIPELECYAFPAANAPILEWLASRREA